MRLNGTKVRLIGRERGYHGVNFGGTSVGGIANNRKMFGTLLSGVDHIRHTHDLARNAFTRAKHPQTIEPFSPCEPRRASIPACPPQP